MYTTTEMSSAAMLHVACEQEPVSIDFTFRAPLRAVVTDKSDVVPLVTLPHFASSIGSSDGGAQLARHLRRATSKDCCGPADIVFYEVVEEQGQVGATFSR